MLNITTRTILENLSVVIEPSVDDVVSNITNICTKSPYYQKQLFQNYPKEFIPSKEVDDLLKTMNYNLSFLSRHLDQCPLTTLASLHCIPVYAIPSEKDFSRMVLVKPSCVIVSCVGDQYHPFLHSLPTDLHSMSNFFSQIGVKSSIDVQHLQILLEQVYLHSNGMSLDPNSYKCVALAVKEFSLMLPGKEKSKILSEIQPLYLPDAERVMKLSTTLLYGDTPSYFGHMQIDCTGTSYSYFDLNESEYKVSSKGLCWVLPPEVRPHGMSVKCKQLPEHECIPIDDTITANLLVESFENDPIMLVQLINRLLNEQSNEEEMMKKIETILSSIKITTVQNLKSQKILRDSEDVIGRVKSQHFFTFGTSESQLYIDSKNDQMDEIVSELTTHIWEIIFPLVESNFEPHQERNLLKIIERYLKSNPSQKITLAEDYRIDAAIMNVSSTLNLDEIGVRIPESYHHRLDQDSNNVFNPMEYVAYAVDDNEFIVAQVVYSFPDEGSHYLRKYLIYIKKDDSEGKKVDVLELYNFLMGHKEPMLTSASVCDDTQALVPHEEGDLTKLQASLHDSTSIQLKRSIYQELKEIQKLIPDLKRKALRRLYLKYHPDKNLDEAKKYEDTFLYVKAQISHLDNGEPLDDRDVEFTDVPKSENGQTNFDMNNWNRTASAHAQHNRREQNTASASSRGGGGTGGYFPSSDPFNPFKVFEEDRKDPAEGKKWVKQAEMDYQVLQDQLHSRHYGHVCFMAHQVAEKALKGAVYALCGPDGRTLVDHNLQKNALTLAMIQPVEAADLIHHCSPLETYHLHTRYPNCWPGSTDVPSDHYKMEEAEEAKAHAEEVLRVMSFIMP